MGFFMGLLMGVLGGPALAMAVNSKQSVTKFEENKAKFAKGEGKNPELSPFGPHKSFAQNAIMFGILFFVIGFFAGSLAS